MGIVVLGMHRSGTSVLSRFLGILVDYQGHPGVADDNQEGHWEIPRINYELEVALRLHDSDWASPPLQGMELPLAGLGSIESLRSVVAGLNGDEWVLKDPRFCICADDIARISNGATMVATYRAPLEVAKSIESRDGYTFEYGLALWEVYNRQLLLASQRLDRVLWLPYDKMIADPVSAATEMAEKLRAFGHTVTGSSESAAPAAINHSLRHQRNPGYDSRMSEEQVRLLEGLELASEGHAHELPPIGEITPWSRALIETRRPYSRMERDNKLLRKRVKPLVPAYRALDEMRRRLDLRRPEDPFG